MVDLLKFTFNKKKYWIELQPYSTTKLAAKFCPIFNYVGPKKILGLSQIFFKNKKLLKF